MVRATIKGFEIDHKDHILAIVEYDIDGKIITNPYPFSRNNLIGLPRDKAEAWLETNIIFQCDCYILSKFKEVIKTKNGYSNDEEFYVNYFKDKQYKEIELDDLSSQEIIKLVLDPMIGRTYTREEAPLSMGISVDTGDIESNKTIVSRIDIKSDGTFLEKAL